MSKLPLNRQKNLQDPVCEHYIPGKAMCLGQKLPTLLLEHISPAIFDVLSMNVFTLLAVLPTLWLHSWKGTKMQEHPFCVFVHKIPSTKAQSSVPNRHQHCLGQRHTYAAAARYRCSCCSTGSCRTRCPSEIARSREC